MKDKIQSVTLNRNQKLFGPYSQVIGWLMIVSLSFYIGFTKFSNRTPGNPDEYQAALTEISGLQVYNDACLLCHGAGVGGAPVLEDAEQWTARIAQGNEVLYQNAIQGYIGEDGFMPPKGARMDLSDDEIRAAVDYMVSEAGN